MDDDVLHPLEASKRQRQVILRVIRMTFAVLLLTVAILNAAQSTVEVAIEWWIPVALALAMFGVALAIDLLTPNKKISSISSVFLGIMGGMLATVALGAIFDLLLRTTIEVGPLVKLAPFISLTKLMLGITLCYLGIITVLQTQDDFRLVIPYVEFSKQSRGARPFLMDTSSLIDARIVELAETGLVQSAIVVPRFVIGELQALADSTDRLKRARGRRGLDVTSRLQRSGLDVTIDETPVPVRSVDQMLVDLARRIPATIVTSDVGLSRVAQIQNVPVLNLNDVANALKPSLIPGEQITLRLIKNGEQPGQGVGYLADGTMVVVEQGATCIGEEAAVLVTSSLQTSAGRLIFGKLAGETEGDEPSTLIDSQGITPNRAAQGLPPGIANGGETARLRNGLGEQLSTESESRSGEQQPGGVTHPDTDSSQPDSSNDPASRARQSPERSGETTDLPQDAVRERNAPKQGPFPSKPPQNRSGSPRNPRR